MKPLTLPTGEITKYIGISRDELRQLKKKEIFKRGIHYTIPRGKTHPLWVVEEMEKWALEREEISDTAKAVLDNVTSFNVS